MRKEIKFEGNEETYLNTEIAIYLGEWKEGLDPSLIPNYEIGKYLGKSIYKIENVLYQLTKDSWVCNTEYHWYLKEVTQNCYNSFK